MRHKDLFKTYIWLIETVLRNGPLDLEEIKSLWEKSSLSDGIRLSRSSFNRHREEIEDIFGLRIVCDRGNNNRYSIENEDCINRNSVQMWMANIISFNNIISENRTLGDRILMESIPSEGRNLQTVIESMKKSRMIEFDYLKHHSGQANRYVLEPYCVKLYHRRWYLLARYQEEPKEFRIFAFDRIVQAAVSDKRFLIDKNFDAASFFSECFGVAPNMNVPVQRITIRAYGTEQYYMRDLPIHPSQRLVAEGDGFSDYEVTLRPTEDFLGHLLSRGQWVRIMSPKEVEEQFLTMVRDVQERYQ